MGGAERVVFALAALGEAGQPAFLAQRADAVAATGQDLVRIGLVADIPDQPVVGRVEDVVQGDGQLDNTQPAPRWPPVIDTASIKLGAQFGGQLRQVALGKLAQVGGNADLVQKGVWGDEFTEPAQQPVYGV